jgi:hypothetical protein
VRVTDPIAPSRNARSSHLTHLDSFSTNAKQPDVRRLV